MNNLIKLCRPAHAVKNLLVLLPPFFAQKILEKEVLSSSFFAFSDEPEERVSITVDLDFGTIRIGNPPPAPPKAPPAPPKTHKPPKKNPPAPTAHNPPPPKPPR